MSSRASWLSRIGLRVPRVAEPAGRLAMHGVAGDASPVAGGPAAGPGGPARGRMTFAGIGAAILGAAPHVLHHVGPLAGAALLAGASGRVLFGVLGFAAAMPMLRRMHRRTGSWRIPAGALGVMAAVFGLSSFVLGPAIAGGSDSDSDRAKDVPTTTRSTPSGHDGHH